MNVHTTYDKLCKNVDSILKGEGIKSPLLRYSIFKDDEKEKYSIDNWPIIHNDFNEVIKEGKIRFIYDCYGEGIFKSEIIINPTYKNLIIWSEKLIRLSGDHHHIFLEECRLDKIVVENGENIYYYSLVYGS